MATNPQTNRSQQIVNDADISAANPLPVTMTGTAAPTPAGGTGADFSATAAGTAAAVPVAGFVLLTTVPATPGRASVEVQNQSGGTVQMVRDVGDGTQQSSVLLGGTAAGVQGGGWASLTFKGRVRLYGATGAQVSAFQD